MCPIPLSLPCNPLFARLPCNAFSFPLLFPLLGEGNPSCFPLTPSLPWRANQTHLELPWGLLAAGSASNSWSREESPGQTLPAWHPTHTLTRDQPRGLSDWWFIEPWVQSPPCHDQEGVQVCVCMCKWRSPLLRNCNSKDASDFDTAFPEYDVIQSPISARISKKMDRLCVCKV